MKSTLLTISLSYQFQSNMSCINILIIKKSLGGIYEVYFCIFIKLKLQYSDYTASYSKKLGMWCMILKHSYHGWILHPPALWNGVSSQQSTRQGELLPFDYTGRRRADSDERSHWVGEKRHWQLYSTRKEGELSRRPIWLLIIIFLKWFFWNKILKCRGVWIGK